MPLIPRPEYHTEYTRRLQWEKAVKERDHLRKQIEKLSDYILSISPSGIPEGGAVDVAIKYIKEACTWAIRMRQRALKAEKAHVEMFDAHQRLWKEFRSVRRERDVLEKRAEGLELEKDLYILPMEQQVQDCMRREREAFKLSAKLGRERDELYVSWEADRNSLKLTYVINIKLQWELDRVTQELALMEQRKDKSLGLMKKWMDIASVRNDQAEKLRAQNIEILKVLEGTERDDEL